MRALEREGKGLSYASLETRAPLIVAGDNAIHTWDLFDAGVGSTARFDTSDHGTFNNDGISIAVPGGYRGIQVTQQGFYAQLYSAIVVSGGTAGNKLDIIQKTDNGIPSVLQVGRQSADVKDSWDEQNTPPQCHISWLEFTSYPDASYLDSTTVMETRLVGGADATVAVYLMIIRLSGIGIVNL